MTQARSWVLRGLLLSFVLLQGCQEEARNDIAIALSSAPSNLDPRIATSAVDGRINRLIYRQLVDFDAQSQAIASLASWQVLSPTHYRFVLGQEGRQFHDGRPLTSEDVRATYAFILDQANASPHRGLLSVIQRMEILDEDTIDFHLSHADPLFPGYMVIGIVPRDALDDPQALREHPMGSGGMAFVERPDAGRLSLKRIQDGQVFRFLKVKNPTVRVLKLLRGEVDLLQNDLQPELVKHLEHQEGIRIERAPGINFSYLGFNLEDPITGKAEVRQAIAYAIDRQAIIDHLWGGGARLAQALLVPENWAGNPDLRPISHDPAKARALLASIGHGPDKPLRLTYKTSTDPLRLRIASIFQQQLRDVGIEVDIRSYDWGTFFGDIKAGRFQLYSLTWVGVKSPDIFEYVFHSKMTPPSGANRGRYRSDEADRLIQAAKASDHRDEQVLLYRQLQALLFKDLPYVPLWYEDHVLARRDDIQGYALQPDGNFDPLLQVSRP